MMTFFIKGLFIGVAFGIPAGVIGALSMQRALKYGFLSGFVTGLGSSAADVLYALAGLFGITAIQQFVGRWQLQVSLAGGVIIIIMGISVLVNKAEMKREEAGGKKMIQMFLSSFTVAILNPATILSFLAVFATMEIDADGSALNGAGLVAGIFTGTCIWWLLISGIAVKIRNNMAEKVYRRLYIIMGAVLVIFGTAVIIKGFI